MNPQDQSMTGFGQHSAQQVEDLQKALSIGSDYSTTLPGSLSGGAALAVEDLDRTLKLVTHSMQHLKLWKDIPKSDAKQTVAEFNIQNSYGEETSPFFTMGGTPYGTDAGYNRDVTLIKYLGTKGQVQHNLTVIQAAHGPVVAREVKNKTVELLTKNERAMFTADSNINALEYDGVEAQITAKEGLAKYKATAFAGYESAGAGDSVILDSEGEVLSEDKCEDACLTALNNFGMPMDMYLSTDIHSSFSKAFYAKQVTRPGDSSAAGYRVPEFTGSLNFRFKSSVFNRPRKAPLATAVSATAAPTTANGASPVDADSEFSSADAGTYSYKISAVYEDGETLPTAKEDIAVTAGDKVTTEITFTGTPLYFNVFRAPVDTTEGWEFIGRVAKGTSGDAHDIDFNAKQPGKGTCFLLMNDEEALSFKQLGSMIKYDLAVTDTSYKWLQLLYGAPEMPAVRKHVIIKNVASA